MSVTKTDLAYAAGLFDGEGCVTIHYRESLNPNRHHRTPVAAARLVLGMSDEATIRWLRATFGGNVHYRPPKKAHWQPCWIWQAGHAAGGAFLEAVMPYLRTKRRQAELFLEFRARLIHPALGKAPLEPDEVAARRGIVLELHAVNGRQGTTKAVG